jgi:hypothetical protein
MHNLAVRVCNVVVLPDYSSPHYDLNLYNIIITIYKAGGAPFPMLYRHLVDRQRRRHHSSPAVFRGGDGDSVEKVASYLAYLARCVFHTAIVSATLGNDIRFPKRYPLTMYSKSAWPLPIYRPQSVFGEQNA